jgi:hypothetical protein
VHREKIPDVLGFCFLLSVTFGTLDDATGGSLRALLLHLNSIPKGMPMTRIGSVLTNLAVVCVLLFTGRPLHASSDAALNPSRFLTASDFNVGDSPSGIAAADLNKDGRMDVVVTNPGDAVAKGQVNVIMGNGNGTFKPPVSIAVGVFPVAVAIADLNKDGKLDLIVVNGGQQSEGFSPGSVSVLLGNGNGTFQPAKDFPVGIRPEALAVGDFNLDGKLDVAVVNHGNFGLEQPNDPGSVSILLGTGDGSLKPPVNYPTGGSAPFSLTAADFDGDGVLDLAIANTDEVNGIGSLSILLGKRDGSFHTAVNVGQVGPFVTSVAAGDVDGDGKTDLVEVVFGGGVNVFLGMGTEPSSRLQTIRRPIRFPYCWVISIKMAGWTSRS